MALWDTGLWGSGLWAPGLWNTDGIGVVPDITTTSIPDGQIAVPYSLGLAVIGDSPITWSLLSGTIPAGLTFSPSGILEGIPTTAGPYSFTVQATNAYGSDTQLLSISIAMAAGPVLTTGYVRGKFRRWWSRY
jgi:hypothetical protein